MYHVLAEIAPKNIHIQENAPLTLTCSILPEFRDEYNATDLYFIKNKVYDAQHHYVTFPNNYQAVLYIPRAKHDELRGIMKCEMRNWNTCFHHAEHTGTRILFRRKYMYNKLKHLAWICSEMIIFVLK